MNRKLLEHLKDYEMSLSNSSDPITSQPCSPFNKQWNYSVGEETQFVADMSLTMCTSTQEGLTQNTEEKDTVITEDKEFKLKTKETGKLASNNTQKLTAILTEATDANRPNSNSEQDKDKEYQLDAHETRLTGVINDAVSNLIWNLESTCKNLKEEMHINNIRFMELLEKSNHRLQTVEEENYTLKNRLKNLESENQNIRQRLDKLQTQQSKTREDCTKKTDSIIPSIEKQPKNILELPVDKIISKNTEIEDTNIKGSFEIEEIENSSIDGEKEKPEQDTIIIDKKKHKDPISLNVQVLGIWNSVPKYINKNKLFGNKRVYTTRSATTQIALEILKTWKRNETVELVVLHLLENDLENKQNPDDIIVSSIQLMQECKKKYPNAIILFSEPIIPMESNIEQSYRHVSDKLRHFCENEDSFKFVSHKNITGDRNAYEDCRHINERATGIFVKNLYSAHRFNNNEMYSSRNKTWQKRSNQTKPGQFQRNKFAYHHFRGNNENYRKPNYYQQQRYYTSDNFSYSNRYSPPQYYTQYDYQNPPNDYTQHSESSSEKKELLAVLTRLVEKIN